MSSRLDAALAYAEKGWAVLPLRGKLPAIAKSDGGRGVHDATADVDTIKKWWSRWPDANVGVACGEASGFWTLDVDPRHDGDETLAELEKLQGDLPTTVEQFTGGGGRHILFKFNGENIRNRANHLGAGLDTRASGGYIVVEPSCHPETKRPYAWNVDAHPDEVEIVAAPAWLLERVTDKPKKSAPKVDPFLAFGQRVSNGGAYAEAALVREVEAVEAAALGRQEHTLNAAALSIGSLVGAGALDYATARAALTEAGLRMANEPDREPWTREQIAAKIGHGLRDGMAKPRELEGSNSKPTATAEADEDIDDSQYKPRRFIGLWANSLRPVLSRRDLVKGLIPRKALTVCWGAPSSGKTFWVLDVTLHIALGLDYLGRRVEQAPMIYLNAEGGDQFNNRLAAWRKHHGLGNEHVPLLVYSEPPILPADAKELLAAIRDDLGDLKPGGLVVDTVNKVITGSTSADDDMRALVRCIRRFMAELECAAIFIHHCGWDATHMSGSRVLQADADCEISIVDDGGLRTVTHHKMRDGSLALPLYFQLEQVVLGTDEDGDEIASCVVAETKASKSAPPAKLSPKQRRGLDALLNVLVDHGQVAPDTVHYPAGVQVVSVDLWREYLFESGTLDKDAANPRADFKRLKDQLVDRARIGEWNSLMWAVQPTEG